MKIRLALPWGGEFENQREPMSEGRFYAVCFVIGGAMAPAPGSRSLSRTGWSRRGTFLY